MREHYGMLPKNFLNEFVGLALFFFPGALLHRACFACVVLAVRTQAALTLSKTVP